MEYVRFGNTGMKVSKICLGTMTYGKPTERWPWALTEQESRPFIQKALELGINFFDTADMYSYGTSEEVIGILLKEFVKRDDVVIATKVFNHYFERFSDRFLSLETLQEHFFKTRNFSESCFDFLKLLFCVFILQ